MRDRSSPASCGAGAPHRGAWGTRERPTRPTPPLAPPQSGTNGGCPWTRLTVVRLTSIGGGPPPPPPTKVTIVGNNGIYRWENLIRSLLVHELLGPSPPPPALLSSDVSLHRTLGAVQRSGLDEWFWVRVSDRPDPRLTTPRPRALFPPHSPPLNPPPPDAPPPPMPPPPPPQGASGQQLVGGVVGAQNRGVAPPPPCLVRPEPNATYLHCVDPRL